MRGEPGQPTGSWSSQTARLKLPPGATVVLSLLVAAGTAWAEAAGAAWAVADDAATTTPVQITVAAASAAASLGDAPLDMRASLRWGGVDVGFREPWAESRWGCPDRAKCVFIV